MMPTIRLLVTDLDNTLYDWVTFFAVSFYKMVDVATTILDVEQERLLDELQEVHKQHNTLEHPFALLETAAVKERFNGLSREKLAQRMAPAFDAFNRWRTKTLKLYPGVMETLQELNQLEVPVVGYTEATVPNALFRLRALGLEQLFQDLFAVTPSGLGHYDSIRHHALLETPIQVRYLTRGERKPNPSILLEICRHIGVSPQQTLFVGDSIALDMGMAKEAGVWAAWAQYGTDYEPDLWNQLVRITHWTEDDVRRSQEASLRFKDLSPDAILTHSLGDIFKSFTFQSPD